MEALSTSPSEFVMLKGILCYDLILSHLPGELKARMRVQVS